MKYYNFFIRNFVLPAVFVAIGCSSSAQIIGECRHEEQLGLKDRVPLWQTAYVADLEEFVRKSDSMIVAKGFPFYYVREHTGRIGLYCTNSSKKRLILQLTDSSQRYISEICSVDCLESKYFVIFTTEDITGGYQCIVVPFDNTIAYISDFFFLDDDVIEVYNILIDKDSSSIRFFFVKDKLTDSNNNNFVDITLSKSKDDIVFE